MLNLQATNYYEESIGTIEIIKWAAYVDVIRRVYQIDDDGSRTPKPKDELRFILRHAEEKICPFRCLIYKQEMKDPNGFVLDEQLSKRISESASAFIFSEPFRRYM